MISYLKNMTPEQKRKYLYAAATVASIIYATWEAHGRNWRATGIALVTAAITKLAHAYVNDPAAAVAQQPVFTVTSALVGPDPMPDEVTPPLEALGAAAGEADVTLTQVSDQIKKLQATLTRSSAASPATRKTVSV